MYGLIHMEMTRGIIETTYGHVYTILDLTRMYDLIHTYTYAWLDTHVHVYTLIHMDTYVWLDTHVHVYTVAIYTILYYTRLGLGLTRMYGLIHMEMTHMYTYILYWTRLIYFYVAI
jgi:hypothetical protein